SVYMVEDSNDSGTYVQDEVTVKKESLFWRKYFRKHSGLLFKAIELSGKWRKYLKKCDAEVLVFHDVQQYLNIHATLRSLGNRRILKTIVWDLHEIPHVE